MKTIKTIIQLLIICVCFSPIFVSNIYHRNVLKLIPDFQFYWADLLVLLACFALTIVMTGKFSDWFNKKLNELKNGKEPD